MIVSAILGLISSILSAIIVILFVPIILGAYAYIYKELVLEVGDISKSETEVAE